VIFWVRWDFPIALRADARIAASWPSCMHGWRTGRSETREIWCARIEARDPLQAMDIVRDCYGDLRPHVDFYFAEEREEGWWPPSDRFPR
jgi:hypothetical protein